MSKTQQNNWRRKYFDNQGNSHQEEDSSSAAAVGARTAAAAAATDMRTQLPPTEEMGNAQPLNWGDMSKTQKRNWRHKHQEKDSSSAAAAAGAGTAAAAAATDMRTQLPPTEETGNAQPLNYGDMSKTQKRHWRRNHQKRL
jgi:transposase-like protein